MLCVSCISSAQDLKHDGVLEPIYMPFQKIHSGRVNGKKITIK